MARSLAFAFVSVVFAVALVPKRAAGAPCPEADRPPSEIGASWDALYAHFKRFNGFGYCDDDGAVAEGNSEAVLTLLDGSWQTLPRLAELIRRDAQFEPFVLKHVDDMMDYNPLRRIRDRARARCPAGLNALCKKIAEAVEGILARAVPSKQ